MLQITKERSKSVIGHVVIPEVTSPIPYSSGSTKDSQDILVARKLL